MEDRIGRRCPPNALGFYFYTIVHEIIRAFVNVLIVLGIGKKPHNPNHWSVACNTTRLCFFILILFWKGRKGGGGREREREGDAEWLDFCDIIFCGFFFSFFFW
jgi:hypothetical protein